MNDSDVAEVLPIKKEKLKPVKFEHQAPQDRIVVEQEDFETVTKAGVILPDTVAEKPLRGTIVAVGPGFNGIKMTRKAGEKILFGKYAGTEVELYDRKYLIMREADIYLILK